MASNYKVSTDIDTLLRKSTKEEVATFLGVDTNTANIATNTVNIATNTADIATNTADIDTNIADIATNKADIATNTANIATNTANIATNAANIATNSENIATNTEYIASNAGDIEFNRSQINYLMDSVDELYPVYPYTTSISAGVGKIKNLRNADLDSGYRLDLDLTSVTLGSNCKSLGAQTFQGCDSLVEFYYHNSTAGTIGDMCFENCIKYGQGVNAGGNGFTLGKNITAIGNSSYRGCTSLKTVYLSNYDLAAVGRFAFEGCTALEEFTFPFVTGDSQNTFTVVSESVLRNCTALTQIDIPHSVTEIHAAAFRDCTALQTIRCYAMQAPTLVGPNQFLNVPTGVIRVPVGSTGYNDTYAGLQVSYSL